MADNTRGKMGSIPPAHDVLGAPNLRDQQGPPTGETRFQQIAPKNVSLDVTKSEPGSKRYGDFKVNPGGMP